MAIVFDKIVRRNPQDRTVKYYASVKRIKQVNDKDVAKKIAEETTLNPKEAEMAINQLEKVMLTLLKSGYSVKLGDWASFSVSVKSKGVTNAADVTPALVKEVRVNCRFSKAFKDSIAKIEYAPVANCRSENPGGDIV